jgi:hypothetical protein
MFARKKLNAIGQTSRQAKYSRLLKPSHKYLKRVMADAKWVTLRVTNTFSLNDLTEFVLQFSLFASGFWDPSAARATLCFQ